LAVAVVSGHFGFEGKNHFNKSSFVYGIAYGMTKPMRRNAAVGAYDFGATATTYPKMPSPCQPFRASIENGRAGRGRGEMEVDQHPRARGTPNFGHLKA
jgi:hypothetical protein